MNADGKPDLVFAFLSSQVIGVLLGNGDSTFQPAVLSSSPYNVSTLAVADFNGDGRLDVAANYMQSGMSIFLGNGDGSLQPNQDYGAPYNQFGDLLGIGDLNGDGKPDILAPGSQGVGLYFNLTTPFLYPVTVSLTSSANPGNVDQSITFTATLMPAFNAGSPTGSVTFYDNGSAIGNGTVSNGQAVFTTSSLTLGTHPITASYSGDTAYLPSTSAVLTETIRTTATTTTLMSSMPTSSYGQSVTFTANVTSLSGTPTGSVSFTDGANPLATVPLVSGGATLSVSTLTPGTHSITGTYSGDANFSTSSANIPQVVTQATSTTSVSSSLNPAVWGQSVTFTAGISAQNGVTATGTVTFKDGVTVIGSSTVSGNMATISSNTLAAATHNITATYSGDGNVNGSSSGTLQQVVNPAATTTTVTSNLEPAAVNQSVTYTASVSNAFGAQVTGTVTLKDGNKTLGTFAVGQATFTTSYTTTGLHSITAVYSGDTNDAGSTSAVLKEYIANLPVGTTTKMVTSGSPSTVNQLVTFTATITSTYGSIPNGETVTFYDGTTQIGTGTTLGGLAMFATSTLSVKTHSIKATYAGDAIFKMSSGTVTQVVDAYATTTVLTANPSPSNFGQSVTLTAVVTGAGGVTPTGTVNFKNGASSLGTATLSSGVAVLNTTKLPVGSDSLTAMYNGDSQNAKSTSSAVLQTVNIAQITLALTSSPNPSKLNQSVKFTATLTSNGSLPTGTITFSYNGTTLGTGTISGGKANHSVTTLPAGADQVTATFAGTANYSSASGSVTQNVN